MKRILFVCTGNTCRSPMAEALFRHLTHGALDVQAESAGIAAWPGAPASEGARHVMKERGIDLSAHRSQSLTPQMIDAADLIVVMTASHRFAINRLFPEGSSKVRLLGSFGTDGHSRDIADPMGLPDTDYRYTRDVIEQCLADLILFLREADGGKPSAMA